LKLVFRIDYSASMFNKNNLFNLILISVLLSTTLSSTSFAKIITHCSSEGTDGTISGSSNLNTSYPIASVSKVFTSLWALEKYGATYRFKTQVYLTDLNHGLYDVHLRGSVFPYFDRTMFYYLISELNSIIRTNQDLAHSHGEQTETEIMRELRNDVTNLKSNYKSFYQRTKSLTNVTLPSSVELTVKDIHATSMKSFDRDQVTSSFMLHSVELHRILKEMNRNSNNFAADKLFERLSRIQKLSDYLTQTLQVDEKEFNFVNGSGYPEIIQGKKVYNSATCHTVLKVNKRLYQVAAEQNFGLRYILPVAGLDADADGDSTVTNIYSSNLTEKSLVAKTGTISQSVSLAGAVLTQDNLVYFHITASSGDYLNIKNFIHSLIKNNGGKSMIDNYKPQPFLPFDENSISEK